MFFLPLRPQIIIDQRPFLMSSTSEKDSNSSIPVKRERHRQPRRARRSAEIDGPGT